MLKQLILASIGVTIPTYLYVNSRVHDYDYPLTRPIKTSIILPTYNEEHYIQEALDSILNQNILHAHPEYFEVIVVDSNSDDNTIAIAERYPVEIIESPRGKLTARTIAIDKSKGDIVISVDADIYCPPNFVNLYISHFQDSSVVAVSSPRIVEGILYTPSMLWSILLKKKPIMYGSNSAFRKWAFFESGGWDLDINQLDLDWMVKEEEEDFGNRLSHLGRCIFDIQAPVVTSNRRYFPTGSFLEDTEICERFARHCVI